MKYWMIAFLVLMAGCRQDFPEPENLSAEPMVTNAEEVAAKNGSIRHLMRGKHLFVECVVPGVTFSDRDKEGSIYGKASVYIDGKYYSSYHTAAFIVKGIEPGRHEVKVKLTDKNNKAIGFEKQFFVVVP
ncbi:short-subunit dehydrogenase [Bacillus ectoiniformans]|uniref:hypothetical protein n=1 Tax=Bacillus ectoiniformans TaxID=1494429 RepID=UPI00195B749A|nr:hypothetical protein [Bacillus ectoiniformans]MBM7647244.1 short-subunit dehydrogenase [Bacillus ectoiniformans]